MLTVIWQSDLFKTGRTEVVKEIKTVILIGIKLKEVELG